MASRRQPFDRRPRLRTMNIRSIVAATAAALAATLVPSAALTADAATATLQPATSPVAAVPAHSYLAVIERGPSGQDGGIVARSQRLVLVAPTGETRTVYSRPASRKYGGFLLLDWSADGRTALLSTTRKSGPRVVIVDVQSGAVQELAMPLLQTAVLDPAGTGLLATSWKNDHSNTLVLDRVSWTGARTRLLDATDGMVTPGRNGTVLTLSLIHI